MLKVASFPITDDKGINELLTRFRLASGAHILVSEGHVCIPYEDGELPNNAQQAIFLSEMRNTKHGELALMTHSQEVLKRQLADAEEQYNALDAAARPLENSKKKEDREEYKRLEEKMKIAKNKGNQMATQLLQNEYELASIKMNIDVFEQRIEELK